jgi:nicotinate-nucleotide pyrophosphorylase (carboxylating)
MQPSHHDITAFLAEDIGTGDITAQLISEDTQATASVVCREAAVLCGQAWFDAVFAQLDPEIKIEWYFQDGNWLAKDAVLCQLNGPARALLTGERTALNLLQTLSATATQARRYADAINGTGCRILDTRKTLPGLRLAQKYAVRCGGCHNHRLGLYDAILIKENHIAAAGSIATAVAMAKARTALLIEVEVENLHEFEQAVAAKPHRIMLDNFSIADMQTAVAINQHPIELEASGNITLETIRNIAETGVDFISIGALTKNINAIDLSMRIDLEIK